MSLPSPSEIASALIAREEMPPEKGDIGPQGMEGGFGPPGPQGAKGNPGTNGTNGSEGPDGATGPQGKQGERGLKGDKGDKGDEGERGIQGVRGETGAAGSGRSLFPRGGGGGGGGSQTAVQVPFTPAGTIAATNVQDAIEEVAAEAGGGFPDASGSGAPGTDPTTHTPGYAYLDTTNGALYMVMDIIGTNEWCLVGGEISGVNLAQGIVLGEGLGVLGKTLGGGGYQVTVTDVDAYNNSTNGLHWIGTGTDGQQTFEVKIGAASLRFNVAGGWIIDGVDLDLSAFTGNIYTGTMIPTADPAVAGQIWASNDALVLSGYTPSGGSGSFLSIAKWT